jgi:hypothetical protein
MEIGQMVSMTGKITGISKNKSGGSITIEMKDCCSMDKKTTNKQKVKNAVDSVVDGVKYK